jgi:hypothetical protein
MINTFMFQDIPDTSGGGGGGAMIAMVIQLVVSLAIYLFIGFSLSKVFAKAGQPGIAGFVPIWNLLVLLKIAGKPAWWFLLFLCGPVGFIISIIMWMEIAKRFGKGAGFGIGCAIFGIICIPMLGFGSATYQGPALQG